MAALADIPLTVTTCMRVCADYRELFYPLTVDVSSCLLEISLSSFSTLEFM